MNNLIFKNSKIFLFQANNCPRGCCYSSYKNANWEVLYIPFRFTAIVIQRNDVPTSTILQRANLVHQIKLVENFYAIIRKKTYIQSHPHNSEHIGIGARLLCWAVVALTHSCRWLATCPDILWVHRHPAC